MLASISHADRKILKEFNELLEIVQQPKTQ